MLLRPTQGIGKRLGPATTFDGTVTLSLSSRLPRRAVGPERTRFPTAPLSQRQLMRFLSRKAARRLPAPLTSRGNLGSGAEGPAVFFTSHADESPHESELDSSRSNRAT